MLGRPFYIRFFRALKHKHGFTTDTLVVLSTSIAYAYSIIAMTAGQEVHFFEASASVLTIFTVGGYLEGRVLRSTSESLRKLLEFKPKTATVVVSSNGREEVVDADSIAPDNIVIVKPGEKIATDGVVLDGQSSVDESMISGESVPVDKGIGDQVIGGTINKSGYLRFKATTVGANTVLSHIVETVEKARRSKAPIQRLADRAVRYFVPIVLTIATISSLFWLLLGHEPVAFVVTVFATVLVVSCPCALGIATPMVVSLGIDRAAKEGVLIKGGQYLERLASVDTIVCDKTGTLTKGKPEVIDVVVAADNYQESYILQLASSAEIKSEHPIAQAIVKKAAERKIDSVEVSEFDAISGHGVVVTYLEKEIFVGSPRSTKGVISDIMQLRISELESQGKTVVAVFIEEKLAGLIAVADTLRENAKQVIDELKRDVKEVILMSGDNERTAKAIARKVGIDIVLSQVLPETKAQEIKKLQDQGRIVAMVGDGINDAPALTQADVGIAMGSGTDVAMAAGHVILMKNNLQGVLTALKIGTFSLKKIKQNLAISFAYNAITMSIAAGIFYSITNSLILTPSLAALGWIVSDSLVFGNSLLIKRFNVSKTINSKHILKKRRRNRFLY
jgi:Cu+-exporting ATPase